jgi:hypothetical protein
MFVALMIGVPIILFAVWAVAYDLKRRRQRAPLTDHNPRQVAQETRMHADGKRSEWGGPVM